MVATLTAQATDYFHTNSGRYKVVGENLFTQGSPEDNMAGWKNHAGTTLDQAITAFALENEGGPDGGKYLRVLSATEDANILNTDVMLEPGLTYLATYKVKGTAERASNNLGTTSNNTQNFFINADGSLSTSATGYAAMSSRFYYYDQWKEVNAVVTVPADAPVFLVATFYNLLEGDGFADFAVYPVEKVSDDRVLQRYIDRAKLLLTIPELTNGKGALQGMLEEMETFLETNESESEQNDYMEGLKNRMVKFLDANGADAAPYFSNFTFDQTSTPKANSNVSGWETGGRWGTSGANNMFETTYGVQWIGNSYELGASSLRQQKSLPSGKYLYVISAMGQDKPNKSDIVDYNTQVTGVKMFINADSLELDDLPTWNPKSYAKVFTVAEGEDVMVGVHNTGTSNANTIGFDNHYLYLIGGTTEQIEAHVNAKKLADAQNALIVMIDSAKVVVEKPQYVFGKPVLRDSIAISEAVYAAETDPASSPAVLTQQMNYMRSAIRNYYTLNAEIVLLKEDIDDCNGLLAEERYTEGKPELQAVVTAAETFYAAVNPEVRDSAAIMQQDEALVIARENFYVANSSYKNPGLLTIQNPTFREGPTSRSQAVPGWDDANINRNSKSGWAAAANTAFETGYAINYARNSNSCESKYLAQDVALVRPGVYSFSAEMMAYHAAGKNNANTGVYFFLGHEGLEGEKIDSLVAYTPDQVPVRYNIQIVVNEPTTLRFGVDARNNKSCSRIFVSGCQVKFYGPYDKYQTDSVKAVAQPTVDSLAAEIAYARDLKNTSRNKEQFAAAVQTFETAISHAETVKAKEVASLAELIGINDEITTLKEAEDAYMISGVWPAENTYFDLTRYIKNAELTDTLANADGEFVFTDWTCDGNYAYYGEGALMTHVFNADSKADMKVHQVIEGMPVGKYQFIANATYKLETNGQTFPQDEDMNGLIPEYNKDNGFYVVANEGSATMKGVLTGCEEDKWSEVITAWNYRHNHPSGILDGDRFLNSVSGDVTAADGGKMDIGIEVKGAKATQLIWAKNFALYFWGDKVGDVQGIDATLNDKGQMINDKVYDLQGRPVSVSVNVSVKKGLYIQNGRKVVVK